MGVDQNIVDAVYTRLLQSLPPDADIRMCDQCIIRLLEVVNTMVAGDGESYASSVTELFASIEGILNNVTVSEAGVERILSYLQYCEAFDYSRHSSTHQYLASDMFQVQCAASLLAKITEEESNFGPTMLVVISALSAQYCTLVSVPPAKILSGIASRLADVPGKSGLFLPLRQLLRASLASVQDACILAMLRLAAMCDVSDEVNNIIARVCDNAGRHIQKVVHPCLLRVRSLMERNLLAV